MYILYIYTCMKFACIWPGIKALVLSLHTQIWMIPVCLASSDAWDLGGHQTHGQTEAVQPPVS